jgi:predicted amidophosphoribosyltransferase
VPGSSPPNGELWPALALARGLKELGIPARVWPGLRRTIAVRKSATAAAGARPTTREHYESFSFSKPCEQLSKVILVDDVITKGRTLLAAAGRVRDVLPHADVRAFALIRTLGRSASLERLVQECQGVVKWSAGDARRDP